MEEKVRKLVEFSKEIYRQIKEEKGEEMTKEDIEILEEGDEHSLVDVIYIVSQIKRLIGDK